MEHVLVLGATSAVATEAARLYSARGARLHLVGRDATKLAAVAEACRATTVTTRTADFALLDGAEAVIAEAFAALEDRVDIVLVAHGDLGDQLASERSFDDAAPILTVNFTSVVALLVPIANRMEAARYGRIAVIGSVAGDRGRPRNYTYGAAKGALRIYLQGLRSRLYPAGVQVTTVKLGPVDSPMTRYHAKNVLFARPDSVAAALVAAVDAGANEVYVPWFWRLIMPAVRRAPERLFQRLGFLSGR